MSVVDGEAEINRTINSGVFVGGHKDCPICGAMTRYDCRHHTYLCANGHRWSKLLADRETRNREGLSSDCQLNLNIVMALLVEGREHPCDRCNIDREKCRGYPKKPHVRPGSF